MKISRFVTVAALLFTVFVPSATAGISAEFAAASPELTNAPFGKANPNVASNGTDFFVVWRDLRSFQETLFGARVTAGGEVLDPTGIRIADYVQNARVVWSGDAWIVVWTWPGTNPLDPRPTIMAARIERDGRLARMAPVARGHAHTGDFAAANGNRTAILYLSVDTPGVRSVVIDPELNVLGDHALTTSNANRDHLSVTAAGEGFFGIWNYNPSSPVQLEGARLDATGRPLEPARLLATGMQPQAAEGDDRNLVVLMRHQTSAGAIWATRQVREDLTHVTTPSHLIDGATLHEPTLLHIGSGYVVLGQNTATSDHEVTATRLDAAGNFVGDPVILTRLQVLGISPAPAAATNGTDILLTWIESDSNHLRTIVRAQLFDAATLAPKSPVTTVSRSAPHQSTPALAFNGTSHLAVWSEPEGVRAGRIGPDGRPLDGPGLLLSRTTALPQPRVVFDGRSYVVAWNEPDGGSVVVRFLDPQTMEGPELRVPTGWTRKLTMATSGEHTIIVWSDLSLRLSGVRVGRESRQVEVAPAPLALNIVAADFPSLAWNGSEFLLAFVEHELVVVPVNPFTEWWPKRIRGTRLSSTLLPLDPGTPVLAESVAFAPLLASLQGEWLLVWSNSTHEGTVRARRIGRELTPAGDTIELGQGFEPALTTDGSRFVVAFLQLDRLVRVMHLTRELAATTTTFAMSNVRPHFGLAPAPNHTIAIAYTRFSLAPEHGGVDRAFLRFVSHSTRSRAVR